LIEFETLDTGMGPPEGVRRGRIRDSKLVEDESVEIDNTVEKSARARGIDTPIS
jgi:hypothetical protein